ncbi:MAG: hypothetical protein WAO71_05190 [Gallionella sp.]
MKKTNPTYRRTAKPAVAMSIRQMPARRSVEIKSPEPKGRTILQQDWLKIITMLGATFWVVFSYLSHDREQKELDIESKRISNNQLTVLAKIEKESKELSIEQQYIALEMANFAAKGETERAQSETERNKVSFEQQRLNLEQSTRLAQLQFDREQLSKSILELDKGLKNIDFLGAKRSRIATTTALRINCTTAANQYEVTFDTKIENVSDKKEVEISWELRSMYIGIPRAIESTKRISMRRINEPPDAYTNKETSGSIAWELMGNSGYVYPGTKAKDALQQTAFHFSDGGLLTKVIRPKDEAFSTVNYEVSAPPGYWVAIILRIGLDGATEGDDLFRFAKWIKIPTCSKDSVAN